MSSITTEEPLFFRCWEALSDVNSISPPAGSCRKGSDNNGMQGYLEIRKMHRSFFAPYDCQKFDFNTFQTMAPPNVTSIVTALMSICLAPLQTAHLKIGLKRLHSVPTGLAAAVLQEGSIVDATALTTQPGPAHIQGLIHICLHAARPTYAVAPPQALHRSSSFDVSTSTAT